MKRIDIGMEILLRLRLAYRRAFLELSCLDLGGGQLAVLLAVLDQPGLCQEDVCDMVRIDKSTMTKAVKRLHEKGYLVVRRDESDGRLKRLEPSARAVEVEPLLRRHVESHVKGLLADLSKKEARKLLSLLERLG